MLHCVELIGNAPAVVELYAMPEHALKERGDLMVEKYRKVLDEKKLPNTQVVLLANSHYKEALVDWCKHNRATTFICGSRGLSGTMQRWMLGSFSRYAVNHLECDVMVVKPKHS